MLNGAYHFLDLVPKGRDEDSLNYPMEWVRRLRPVLRPRSIPRQGDRPQCSRSPPIAACGATREFSTARGTRRAAT
ncbi:hypothetical protein [Ensifer canadensis]